MSVSNEKLEPFTIVTILSTAHQLVIAIPFG